MTQSIVSLNPLDPDPGKMDVEYSATPTIWVRIMSMSITRW